MFAAFFSSWIFFFFFETVRTENRHLSITYIDKKLVPLRKSRVKYKMGSALPSIICALSFLLQSLRDRKQKNSAYRT